MSERDVERPIETRWVQADGARKSLASFEVSMPTSVETPMSMQMEAPSTPESQATPPTDYDG